MIIGERRGVSPTWALLLVALCGVVCGGTFAARLFSGICITPWQCGHVPFLPAAARGVRTSCPHKLQKNSIGPVSATSTAGDGVVGLTAGAFSTGVLLASPAAGIRTIAAQLGHFPRLPAVVSGVRICCVHSGQENSIVMTGDQLQSAGIL